jgi:hypothetical protein
MQIKVEIQLTPEEMRRFLGLPDVGGLQDDIIGLLRSKVGAASEFDASGFLRQNLDSLRRNPAWQKILSKVVLTEDGGKGAAPAPRKRSAARKPRVRRPQSAVRDD